MAKSFEEITSIVVDFGIMANKKGFYHYGAEFRHYSEEADKLLKKAMGAIKQLCDENERLNKIIDEIKKGFDGPHLIKQAELTIKIREGIK